MRRILFYDLSDASASPIHMVNWVQKQTANPAVNIGFAASFSGRGRSHWSGGGDAAAADKETAFPLVLLSYSDLVELADASVALLACQGDGVFIFTPHFCGGDFIRIYDLKRSNSIFLFLLQKLLQRKSCAQLTLGARSTHQLREHKTAGHLNIGALLEARPPRVGGP